MISDFINWFHRLGDAVLNFFSKRGVPVSPVSQDELDQNHARLHAMQGELVRSRSGQFAKIKAVASHSDLPAVNKEYWFEGDAKAELAAARRPRKGNQNMRMTQSKMTHTRLQAYVESVEKNTAKHELTP